MDAACLTGLCQVQVAAASATGAADGTAADRSLSQLLTLLGIIVILTSLGLARWLLHRYRDALLNSMSSDAALGDAGARAGWDSARILGAMESRRRRVLGVLIGVTIVYSAVAAEFYSFDVSGGGGTALSLAVTFCLFLAFSGPVVLLGVSAAGFTRSFWGVFAPFAFMAAAMQVVVVAGARHGGSFGTKQFLVALACLAAITAGIVVVVRYLPPTWRRRPAKILRRWRWTLIGAVIVAIAVVGGQVDKGNLVLPRIPQLAQWLVLGCLVGALAILLFQLTLAERAIRIMVPLVGFTLMTVVLVSIPFGIAFERLPLSSWPPAQAFLVSWGLALAVAVAVSRALLRGVVWAYERKAFSDAQFQVFTWMLAVTGIFAFANVLLTEDGSLVDRRSLSLALAALAALVAYGLLTRLLVRPLPLRRRLLVLRVFSRAAGRESLLEDLEYRWRFIGPIVLVGAPDFASRTLDPGDAARFLRSLRVRDVFIDTVRQLERRLLNMDEAPDSDGRFRVNEFFCRNDTWEAAVEMLLESSEAVLVDLREFDATHGGTRRELQLLDRHRALARTVFLVGPKTDLGEVARALGLDSADRLQDHVQLIDEASPERPVLVEALVRRMPAEPLPGLLLQPRDRQAAPSV